MAEHHDGRVIVQRATDVLEQVLAPQQRLVAGDIRVGELPPSALSHDQPNTATTALLHLVPEAENSGPRHEVEAPLDNGDVDSALTAVAPVAVSNRVQAAAAGRRGDVRG